VPAFENSIELPCSPAHLFDFLTQPKNLLVVSPPELGIQLVEFPERLLLGSRVTIVGRRWGVSQRMITEVIALDPEQKLTDEQREGPFRNFRHIRSLAEFSGGVRLTERIEFDPPGGLIGMMMTAARIQQGLAELGEFRFGVLRKLFKAPGA
jgi:ligand-binding SRPBCC domain-containing protein